MGCNITTGYSVGAAAASTSNCVITSPGKIVLFDPTTLAGTKRSNPFTIPEGSVGIIDGYNLKEGYHIYLNKLVILSKCVTTGCGCDGNAKIADAMGEKADVAFRSRMTIGNNPGYWSLYNPSDSGQYPRLQMLVAIPGTYELELEDEQAQLMDNMMQVELQISKRSVLGQLPDNYFGGIF